MLKSRRKRRAFLVDLAGGDVEYKCNNLRVIGIDDVAVDIEKRKRREIAGTLVSILEWVVSKNGVEIGCGEYEDIGFAMCRLVERPCQTGFQCVGIPQARQTAVLGDLLVMHIFNRVAA